MNRPAQFLVHAALPMMLIAGCTQLSADDRALLDSTRQAALDAKAAADRAAAAASQSAEASKAAAASAAAAANEAQAASQRADRMFQRTQRKISQ
ncbi:MAG TPA: alanine-zipper protein [Alphaproteobacteria bacterium]|nr:alanine-zipper protein [Alphaproteobacteria bacterium]